LLDTLTLSPEALNMPKSQPLLSPEFRRQMVDLGRAGRDPDDLACWSEPIGHSIRAWAAKARQKAGRQEDAAVAVAAPERDELVRLRRENEQLRLERDVISKALAWQKPRPGLHALRLTRRC
jgi:transposase